MMSAAVVASCLETEELILAPPAHAAGSFASWYDPEALAVDASLFLPPAPFGDWEAALERAKSTTAVPWSQIAASELPSPDFEAGVEHLATERPPLHASARHMRLRQEALVDRARSSLLCLAFASNPGLEELQEEEEGQERTGNEAKGGALGIGGAKSPHKAGTGKGSLNPSQIERLVVGLESGNSHNGCIFDLSSHSQQELVITRIECHLASGGADCTAEMWWKQGTGIGHEKNEKDWEALGKSDPFQGLGANSCTPVPMDLEIPLPPGQTVSIFVWIDGSNQKYSNADGKAGQVFISDGHLAFSPVAGIGSKFSNNCGVRRFNGAVQYQLVSHRRRTVDAILPPKSFLPMLRLSLSTLLVFLGPSTREGEGRVRAGALQHGYTILSSLSPALLVGEEESLLEDLYGALLSLSSADAGRGGGGQGTRQQAAAAVAPSKPGAPGKPAASRGEQGASPNLLALSALVALTVAMGSKKHYLRTAQALQSCAACSVEAATGDSTGDTGARGGTRGPRTEPADSASTATMLVPAVAITLFEQLGEHTGQDALGGGSPQGRTKEGNPSHAPPQQQQHHHQHHQGSLLDPLPACTATCAGVPTLTPEDPLMLTPEAMAAALLSSASAMGALAAGGSRDLALDPPELPDELDQIAVDAYTDRWVRWVVVVQTFNATSLDAEDLHVLVTVLEQGLEALQRALSMEQEASPMAAPNESSPEPPAGGSSQPLCAGGVALIGALRWLQGHKWEETVGSRPCFGGGKAAAGGGGGGGGEQDGGDAPGDIELQASLGGSSPPPLSSRHAPSPPPSASASPVAWGGEVLRRLSELLPTAVHALAQTATTSRTSGLVMSYLRSTLSTVYKYLYPTRASRILALSHAVHGVDAGMVGRQGEECWLEMMLTAACSTWSLSPLLGPSLPIYAGMETEDPVIPPADLMGLDGENGEEPSGTGVLDGGGGNASAAATAPSEIGKAAGTGAGLGGEWWQVSHSDAFSSLRIRPEPSLKHREIAKLEQGEEREFLESRGIWLRLKEAPEGHSAGWCLTYNEEQDRALLRPNRSLFRSHAGNAAEFREFYPQFTRSKGLSVRVSPLVAGRGKGKDPGKV